MVIYVDFTNINTENCQRVVFYGAFVRGEQLKIEVPVNLNPNGICLVITFPEITNQGELEDLASMVLREY